MIEVPHPQCISKVPKQDLIRSSMGSSELTIEGGGAFLGEFGWEPLGSDGRHCIEIKCDCFDCARHNSQLRLNLIGCIHRETDGEAGWEPCKTKNHFSKQGGTKCSQILQLTSKWLHRAGWGIWIHKMYLYTHSVVWTSTIYEDQEVSLSSVGLRLSHYLWGPGGQPGCSQ